MSNFTDFISGGSASQIDEVVILNNSANVVTLADGRVYLKAGVFEDDLSVYPDATSTFFSSEQFPTTGETDPQGITWDGTSLWMVGNSTDTVRQYNTTGVEQSNFSIASEVTNPTGITWDGSYLWVTGDTGNDVTKWSTGGVYQNVSFSVASEDGTPEGITWDGTHFWVIGGATDAVYKYNSSGVYQNVSFSVASQITTPTGITWDGTYFWTTDSGTDKVYKYNSSGVYQGFNFTTRPNSTAPQDITWDGTNFWIVDGAGTDEVLKYPPGVGIHEITSSQADNGVDLNGTVYVRVK